jgi:hypothetical protein
MVSRTTSSARIRLLIFGLGLFVLQALWGCGSDDPTTEAIEFSIDLQPGIYEVSTQVIFSCTDSTDTVSVDSVGVACEFDVTGPLNAIPAITVIDLQESENNGHYLVTVLAEIRIDPCRLVQKLILEGDVTDTSVSFTSKTFLESISNNDSAYEAFCNSEYGSAFPCTTYQTFEATWIGPDTSNVCGIE